MTRNIGVGVTAPATSCTDPHCPFHGQLPVRGQTFEGVVASAAMQRTIVVERERLKFLPKFERYEKRTSRYSAHLPPCIPVKIGDRVLLAECRPLSKTKHFVVVEAREGKLEVRGEDVAASRAAAKAAERAKRAPKKEGDEA